MRCRSFFQFRDPRVLGSQDSSRDPVPGSQHPGIPGSPGSQDPGTIVDGNNFASKFKPKYKEIAGKHICKIKISGLFFSKMSESVRMHPNAPRRMQMHPNVSAQVQTGRNRSGHARKLRKTCEEIETLREIVENVRETCKMISVTRFAEFLPGRYRV